MDRAAAGRPAGPLQRAGPPVGLQLQQWWRDQDGWAEWKPSGWGLGGRVRRITPDATAHLTLPHLADADGPGVGVVLVEVDLATMTQQRLSYKLARYRDYAADQAWKGVHPHCPVLLVLTTTSARAATFLRGAAKLLRGPTRIRDGDDITFEANRLVVAACGHVRDPVVAVSERVWMLPGDTAEITLTDLLTDRIHFARESGRIELNEARERAQARWQFTLRSLGDDRRAVGAAAAASPAAGQVLRLLQAAHSVPDWVAGAGQNGVDLVGWWDPYAGSYGQAAPPPERVTAGLAADYPPEWKAQAWHLAAAAKPIAIQAPVWQEAATRLLAGQLLTAGELAQAACAGESRIQAQERLWHSPRPARPPAGPGRYEPPPAADYRVRRGRAVERYWEGLSRRERWHTSREQLTARYDTQHLTECEVCRLVIPLPHHGQHCPGCGTSRAHRYTHTGDVPELLAALLAVVEGRAPVPAAAVADW